MAKICVEKCKNGKQCTFPALRDSEHCFVHDERPEVAERRTRARQRGGKMRRKYVAQKQPQKLDSIAGIRAVSFQVVEDLCSGRLDITAARAMTYACEVALQAAKVESEKASAEIAAKLTPDEFEMHQLCELAGPEHPAPARLRALHRIAVICELI